MDCREERKSLGRCKEKMKSFRKSTIGLSPIFATLILIAIAVIAGIVVYMFTSGTIASMTGGGTAGQEKAAVQGVDVAGAASVVYAQNTGGVTISITDVLVKDAAGNIVASDALTAAVPLPTTGVLTSITVDLSGLTAGQSYTVTLVSSTGGSFVSSSFVP